MADYKFQIDEEVEVLTNDGWKIGKVVKILPHPYIPDSLNWLIKPNYLIDVYGRSPGDREVAKEKNIRRIKK